MTKQKNDDNFAYYVIEEKPKRKPKEEYYPYSSTEQRYKRFIIICATLCFAAFVVASTHVILTPSFKVVQDALFVNTGMSTSVLTSTVSVIDLAWSSDGNILAVVTSSDLRLYQVDALAAAPVVVLEGYEGNAVAATFSPDGKMLAVSSQIPAANSTEPYRAANITLFDTDNWQKRAVLKGQASYVPNLAFNADSTRLASTGQYQMVDVWNTTTGALLGFFPSDLAYFYDMVFNSEGMLLVGGSNQRASDTVSQKKIQRWDIASLNVNPISINLPEDKAINDIKFNDDGRLVALSTDNGIQIWDLEESELLTILVDFDDIEPYLLAFNPNSRQLAVSFLVSPIGINRAIKIFSLDSGEVSMVIQGTAGLIHYSPDGTKLAGAYQNKVQLYDVQTGNLITEFRL